MYEFRQYKGHAVEVNARPLADGQFAAHVTIHTRLAHADREDPFDLRREFGTAAEALEAGTRAAQGRIDQELA